MWDSRKKLTPKEIEELKKKDFSEWTEEEEEAWERFQEEEIYKAQEEAYWKRYNSTSSRIKRLELELDNDPYGYKAVEHRELIELEMRLDQEQRNLDRADHHYLEIEQEEKGQ